LSIDALPGQAPAGFRRQLQQFGMPAQAVSRRRPGLSNIEAESDRWRSSMTEETREIRLPSGHMASLRRGKGRDLIQAHRAAAGSPEPLAVSFALVAQLAEIDGKPIVFEDVLGMDLEDVLTLQAELIGGDNDGANFPAPAESLPADSPERAHWRGSSNSDFATRS
jgi:hypothetical protein